MKHLPAFAIAATATLAPSWAGAWLAYNQHEVYPVSANVYEVVSEVGSSAADYWCGAGDYAYRELRSASGQRVYLWRGIGPSANRPGRTSVQFSLNPPPGADTDTAGRINLDFNAVGDNLRAAMAQQYCYGSDPWDSFIIRP